MDRLGIDMQVISPSPVTSSMRRRRKCARQRHMVNDHIAEPGRQTSGPADGMGTVLCRTPAWPIAELDRTVKELGFRGVEMSTNVRGVD